MELLPNPQLDNILCLCVQLPQTLAWHWELSAPRRLSEEGTSRGSLIQKHSERL